MSLMIDHVMVVWRGDGSSETYKMFPGPGLLFARDVPQRVALPVAEALVGNNPEPWQGGYCDVFEILEGGED